MDNRVFLVIILLEVWIFWYIVFHQVEIINAYLFSTFWIKVFCGWICFWCFNQSSTITELTNDGKIVRQIEIGR